MTSDTAQVSALSGGSGSEVSSSGRSGLVLVAAILRRFEFVAPKGRAAERSY